MNKIKQAGVVLLALVLALSPLLASPALATFRRGVRNKVVVVENKVVQNVVQLVPLLFYDPASFAARITYSAQHHPPAYRAADPCQPAPKADYGPPPPPPPPPAPSGPGNSEVLAAIQQLSGRFDSIEARLRALEQKAPPASLPPRMPKADEGRAPGWRRQKLDLANNRCASCHVAAVATDRGGGFTFLADARTFASLTSRQEKLVAQRIAADHPARMPPSASGLPALTPAEQALLTRKE